MIKIYPIVTSVRVQKWGITKRVDTPTWDLILKHGLSQGFGVENTAASMMEQYKAWGLLGHNGWDIVTYGGDPVYAANDGIVNQDTVDRSGGIGLDIWNEEGSFKTRYWHNLQNIARMGDKVKRGDLIAYSDNTGFSSGSHIHFALKLTDKYGSTIDNFNGYKGGIDPTPHIVDNKTMPKDALTQLDVRKLNAFRGIDRDDEAEKYWEGKTLESFINTRLQDEARELNALLNNL